MVLKKGIAKAVDAAVKAIVENSKAVTDRGHRKSMYSFLC